MRKVIVSMQVTLDGYVAGPNGELDWLVNHAISEEAWQSSNELYSTVDTVLLGRVNYQGYMWYWPQVESNPTSTPNDVAFSRWLNKVQKIVSSRTLEKAEWENTRLVKDHVAEEITKLKEQPGQNLLIMNSTTLLQTLMQLGLVDEFRLGIHPVVLGGGKPLFASLEQRQNLKLIKSKAAQSGVIEVQYQVVRD